MPLWLQHTLVLILVAACCAYAGWQAWRSLAGKGSKLGSCCAKGCPTTPHGHGAAEQGGRRIVFLPAELLRKKR